MAKYEYELAAVEGIGLTDLEMDAAVALVNGYVARRRPQRGRGGAGDPAVRDLTDKQWWLAHQPLLEKIGDAEKFPLASRVGTRGRA